MEGRSPINIFTLGDTKKYLEEPTYNIYNGTIGQATANNMVPQESNINTMEMLDNQLREQGLQIDNSMSQIEKQNYVDGLTTESYNKMLQYRDAGYSFEASKALLEMGQGAGGGGYRGEGFALNEPLGGADSIWNNMNPIGRIFELIDDQVQQIRDFDDGDDEAFSLWTMIKNIPGSTLKTASAIVRGVSNPLDTINMLKDLIFTSEGREILKQRYGGWQQLKNTLEKDPVGLISDVLAIAEGGAGLVGGTAKVGGLGAKLAGASRVASGLSKFGDQALKVSRYSGLASDMGIPIPYEKGLNALTNKLGEGGKRSQLGGAYLSMTQRPLRTIWNGASTNGTNKILPGVSGAIGRVTNSMKDKIQTQATGLTPEVRERIRQNPYIKEYRDRIEQMLVDEGAPMDPQKILEGPIEEVGNELLRRLEDYEARLEENGTEYQNLRATTKPYNFTSFMAGVYDVFGKNGISLAPDGGLKFSRTANPADMNPIITAWNVIKNMEPQLQNMTISQFLDFRMQLRSLIKYHSDAPSTKYSKNVIRQLVDGELNKLAHKEIPSLAKVDEVYSKEINELSKFKDGLVYQVGEKKGEIKDNFYSIIRTLNTQNRHKMKQRVEQIFPELGAKIEAINMLPILAKTYQNSPKLVANMMKTLSAFTGIKYTQKPIQMAVAWVLGIVMDELISRPLGEKWRKQAIDELMNEMSPEAQQKLAEIKSKVDAGVDLSEQEKRELEIAMQEIAIREIEYLDEKHQKAFQEILESANNDQPKLPGTMDTIGPDGTVKLSVGKQVNGPENYKPKTREERVQEIQQEYQMEGPEAEGMTDSIEDFLDDIGGDINGEINPREVSYDRFSTKTLEKLMEDNNVPKSEKDKIEEILVRRGMEAEVDDRDVLDHQFAWEISKLSDREKKILGMKSKSKSQKEYLKLEQDKERLKEKIGEKYGDQTKERVEEKYADLESKPLEYINEYKKSKKFKEDESEKKVLEKLQAEWSKQPDFLKKMDDNMNNQRQQIIEQPLNEGYERQITSQGDRFVNKQTGQYGILKYNDGKIEAIFPDNEDLFRNSGVIEILPSDARVRFAGDQETMSVGDRRGDEYQTVGRANPNEKTITAEEGLNLQSFKGDKTIGELADEYGLKKQIVEKIFTAEGEEALGRARGDLIELVKEIKEGTAPHEVFHPIFNMVNKKRRQEIIDLVRKHKGITEKEAKERLADSFSEYFRTGKFDTKPIPEGFVNKVKWFFNKVKEFINGTWKSRKKIQNLFDDIMDGKISVQKPQGGRWEYQIQQKSLFDQEPKETKLEAYFKENPYNIDIMYKTYDPDIVEWMNNIKKRFVGGEDITINELYEVKNMIEEHSKDKGTQIDVPDGPTAQLLLEKAESMAKDRIGTYDRKQIEKIGSETEKIIENRIADVDIRYDRGDVKDQDLRDIRDDEFEDFKAEYLYQLGKTYNPDVEKRHDNFKKALKEITNGYEGFKGMTRFGNVVQPNGLNSLKSKIRELEKYSYNDIYNAFEGTYTDQFMRGVEEAKKTLDAEEIDKAVTNLVAVSNMSLENFERQMKGFGGKSPMPSIAIMDPNVPHEAFGELTLVFGRDTIDPKIDPANKIYASDAWTPTFPEIKDKGSLGDYDKVKQMSSDVVDVLYNRGLDIDSSDLGYFAEEIKSQLLDLEGRADLDVNAERLAEQVFRDSVENLENDDYGIKNLSEKVADTGAENTVVDMLTNFIRESTEGEKVIPARYFDNGAMGYLDVSKGLGVAEKLSKMVSDDIVKEVIDTNKGLDRLPNKPETRADVEKYYQSLILTQISDVVQRIEDIGIEPWKAKEELLDFLKKEADLGGLEVNNLVSEIFGNGVAGDRPLTPENVLEAMKNQRLRRKTYPGEFEDMIEIEGTELKDVEDVRRQNFAKVFHGDRIGDLGDLKDRYNRLIDIISEETNGEPYVIKEMIKEAYDPDLEKFKANLPDDTPKEDGTVGKPDIPDEILQRIIDVVEQGKKIPIRFSESKPERIVDLNKEVEYVLVPRKDKARVDEIVKGTPLEGKVVEYTPNDYSAPRSQEMKKLQKKYGNIFFSMGGVIMPIAMLLMMMQGEDEEEGQEA